MDNEYKQAQDTTQATGAAAGNPAAAGAEGASACGGSTAQQSSAWQAPQQPSYTAPQGAWQAPQQPPYTAPQGAWQMPNGPYGAPQGAPVPPVYTPPRRTAQPKSGFLTFCFAFVPGAAQMYLGYFKRGLSLIGIFMLGWWLSSEITSGLWIISAITWMYSFFDAFDLRGKLAAGVQISDDYLIPVKDDGTRRLLEKRHDLVGWGLIVLGCFAAYSSILEPLVNQLCNFLGFYWLAAAFDRIPSVVLIAALIGLGVWLVRGPREKSGKAPEEEVHYYGESAGGSDDGNKQ